MLVPTYFKNILFTPLINTLKLLIRIITSEKLYSKEDYNKI